MAVRHCPTHCRESVGEGQLLVLSACGVSEKRNKTVDTVISRISEKLVAREAALVVIYGLDLGKKHNLDAPQLVVGRSAKADIQVDQESVSRNHAKIINTGKTIILRD